MAKRLNPFSIYLLKPNTVPMDALEADHPLKDMGGANVPKDALLFVHDGKPKPIWWSEYFGIKKRLFQVLKGAILFLKVDARYFAFTFGHVAQYLKETSYEHDFGFVVTLNSSDPDGFVSSDTVEPGPARRKRIQLTSAGKLD
jgi:uncharacterized protein (TIGR04141 family)